jgi:hypothetical protein
LLTKPGVYTRFWPTGCSGKQTNPPECPRLSRRDLGRDHLVLAAICARSRRCSGDAAPPACSARAWVRGAVPPRWRRQRLSGGHAPASRRPGHSCGVRTLTTSWKGRLTRISWMMCYFFALCTGSGVATVTLRYRLRLWAHVPARLHGCRWRCPRAVARPGRTARPSGPGTGPGWRTAPRPGRRRWRCPRRRRTAGGSPSFRPLALDRAAQTPIFPPEATFPKRSWKIRVRIA